jgi:uncharacterized protein (TIGR04255 family)
VNKNPKKLEHAPLQEVLFEIHWKLDPVIDQIGLYIDNDFQSAWNQFILRANNEFPYYVSLKPPTVPEQFFANKAIHQLWKAENKYPVMQLGPGLFTVNDTDKNYTWNDFRSNIITGIKWLLESYNKNLDIDFIEIRYIDAIELNDYDLLNYLDEHLNITITNKVQLPSSKPSSLLLTQRFHLEDDNYLSISINNGIRNIDEVNVIILQTFVNKKGTINAPDLISWVDKSHSVCSDLFKKIISNELYERFN